MKISWMVLFHLFSRIMMFAFVFILFAALIQYEGANVMDYDSKSFHPLKNLINDLGRVEGYLSRPNEAKFWGDTIWVVLSVGLLFLLVAFFQRYHRERARMWFGGAAIAAVLMIIHAVGIGYFALDVNEPRHMLFYERFTWAAFAYVFCLMAAEYFEPLYPKKHHKVFFIIALLGSIITGLQVFGVLPWEDEYYLTFYTIVQQLFMLGLLIIPFLFEIKLFTKKSPNLKI